jgi:translation initiation factor IF-3
MGDNAKVDNDPRLDGRNMVMVLSPNKAKKQATKATKDAAEAAESLVDAVAVAPTEVPEAPVVTPELEEGAINAKDED